MSRSPYGYVRPSLFTQIMPIIESGLLSLTNSPNATIQSTLALRRSLKVLVSVLHEFSGMKMLTGVKTMSQVCRPLSQHHNPCSSSSPGHGPATEYHPRILFSALPNNIKYKWLAGSRTYCRFSHNCSSPLQVSREDGIMVMAPHHQRRDRRTRRTERMGEYCFKVRCLASRFDLAIVVPPIISEFHRSA